MAFILKTMTGLGIIIIFFWSYVFGDDARLLELQRLLSHKTSFSETSGREEVKNKQTNKNTVFITCLRQTSVRCRDRIINIV